MNRDNNDNVVEIENLKMYFPITRGLLRRRIGEVKAVDDISFTIRKNETLGLVGESGCGKTTTGRCILRLYRPTAGKILFNGTDISVMKENKLREIRSDMGSIFQDPYGSLNPRQTARTIVGMPLVIHGMMKKGQYEDKLE
jgi:peptide/nickel transport system ATP-binding protein